MTLVTKIDGIVKPIMVCILLFFSGFSLAEVDRKMWVESTYERLPHLLRAAKTSGSIEDEEVLAFLEAIEAFYNNETKPPLVFVKDSDQFVINPGEDPRLMRAPEGHDTEIFVNEELLSSDSLNLQLLQLIKLLTHELGHKTGLPEGVDDKQAIAARDRWSQALEDFFAPYFLQADNDNGSRVEMLSLPKEEIQRPFSEQPFMIQPTFLVFVHDDQRVLDLTAEVQDKVTEKSMLIRNLSSDLNLALSEAANVVKDAIAREIAPFFDQLIGGLAGAFGQEVDTNMSDAFKDFDGRYQHLSALGIHRLTHYDNTIIMDGYLDFFHSHSNSVSLGLNGLPFAQQQNQPVQVMISLGGESPKFFVQASLELDTSQVAKVKSIRRSNNKVIYLEVDLDWPTEPYGSELVLNFDGGSVRVMATERVALGSDRYKLKFELTDPSVALGEYTYSVVIDDQKVIPLEREVELNQESIATRVTEELSVVPDSFGIWGYRGRNQAKEGTFSHLESPILSPFGVTNEKQFVIPPQEFWVEFEIEEGAEVAGAELYVKVEQYILDIREKDDDDNPTGEMIDSVEVQEKVGSSTKVQRYTSGGTVVETGVVKMSINTQLDHMVVSPGSRPGFQKVRIPAQTPIPKIRDLEQPWEAHRLPAFNPHNLTVTTMDGRRYVHNFQPEIDHTEYTKTHPLCFGLMSGEGKDSEGSGSE